MSKRDSIREKRKTRRRPRQEDEAEVVDDALEAVVEIPSPPAALSRAAGEQVVKEIPSPQAVLSHAAEWEVVKADLQSPPLTERANESAPHSPLPALPAANTPPPTASPSNKAVRWSSATPIPSIRRVRHESQIEHPSPQNPPSWGWGKGEVEGAQEPKEQENLSNASPVKDVDYGNWNGNFGRPDSLGLYDVQGFLKCSPEKEGMLNI